MYKLFIHSIILISFSISEDYIQLNRNIASLINPNHLVVFNQNVVVATNGGLYSLNNDYTNHSSQLNKYNLSTMAVNNDFLWIGNNNNGIIQIFDKDMQLFYLMDYISIGSIYDIAFSDKYAFVLAKATNSIANEYNIIQYNIEDIENPYYLSTIPNISNNAIDIEVFEEKLYISMNDKLRILNQLDNIALTNDWSTELDNNNVGKLLIHNNQLFISYDGKIVTVDSLEDELIVFNDDIEQLINMDNQHFAIISNNIFIIYNSVSNEIIKEIQIVPSYDLISAIYNNNKFYFGLKNNGISIFDNLSDEWSNFIPNTIYKNQFDALALTNEGSIIGIVNHKYEENFQNTDLQVSGFFILENPLFPSDVQVKNFYSYNGYHINNYPLTQSNYNANIINYWSGDRKIHSAVVTSNNNLYFSNSGIYPPSWMGHFENIAENYNFELSSETLYGGVVEIGISGKSNATINDVWNRSENHLGGQYGIFDSNASDGYMITNHLIKDNNDNIWVVNPYSEYPEDVFPDELYKNWPISIKHNSGKWFHLRNNDLAYVPKEIAIDNNSNIWISYLYSDNYSSSGMRFVSFNNITIDDDDYWYPENFINSDINDLDIYSIALSNLPDGNQALWVMCDFGIKGFILNHTYVGEYINIDLVPINEEYYFSDLTFSEGSKIRVDKQENIWISTFDDGVRLINNNGELFSGNKGTINVNNFGILSDIIHDIIFDDYGNVYIATNEGISILETSFTKDFSSKSISVSPNPFIIGQDSEIIISNVSRNSIIKIMNLSGYVIKEFNLNDYNYSIPWDGKDDRGNRLGTGIYLVSAYSESNGIGSTKIAIINK